MTVKQWAPWALGIVLAVGLAVTYRSLGATEVKYQLAVTAANADQKALRDSLAAARAQMATTQARVDTLWRTRTVVVRLSDTLGHRADSLILLAPTDSGKVCTALRAAYDARTSECAQLRVAVALDSQAIMAGQMQLGQSQKSLLLMSGTADSLHRALTAMAKPLTCRILFFPCPSRTMTFLLGAVGLESARIALTGKP
jgi:hypothetical protein